MSPSAKASGNPINADKYTRAFPKSPQENPPKRIFFRKILSEKAMGWLGKSYPSILWLLAIPLVALQSTAQEAAEEAQRVES